MSRRWDRSRRIRFPAVVALLVCFTLTSPPAQVPPRICELDLGPTTTSIRCPAEGGYYYAMFHGGAVSAITSAVCVALQDTNGFASLRHQPPGGPGASCGFYAVLSVPLVLPADLDRDGMDDLFELSHAFLDPLNASDAWADEDGDGIANLVEYRQGRSLTEGAVPGNVENVGLVVHAPPVW